MSTPFFLLQIAEERLHTACRAHTVKALPRLVVDDLDPHALIREMARLSDRDEASWREQLMDDLERRAEWPTERELFWLLTNDVRTKLTRSEIAPLAALAAAAAKADEPLFYCMVDPGLFELIVDLHAAGFVTGASCQGRSIPAEFVQKRHSPAYLSFASPLPDTIRRALVDAGLYVYGEGSAVSAVAIYSDGATWQPADAVRGYRQETEVRAVEDFRDDAIAEVIARNARFEERARRAFFTIPSG